MKIEVKKMEDKLTLKLKGRLDTTTAPKLEEVLKDSLADVTELRMDFLELEYLSSAGLRVLLAASKEMKKKDGTMVVCNVNEDIMEVFTITGFTDILTIQ
ncbi:MAG: STAS domain-containing protein [Roseburia sp.]|nr:STAS domain-containing protein [Roseburia sp.]MCM1280061.1 STAS domain-containing protein [Robinsoniella sp.]